MKKSRVVFLLSPAILYIIFAAIFSIYTAVSTSWDMFGNIAAQIIVATVISAIPIVTPLIISAAFYLKARDSFRKILLTTSIAGVILYFIVWIIAGIIMLPGSLGAYIILTIIPVMFFVTFYAAVTAFFCTRSGNFCTGRDKKYEQYE